MINLIFCKCKGRWTYVDENEYANILDFIA